MPIRPHRQIIPRRASAAAALGAAALLLCAQPAPAQFLNQLQNAAGALGALGGGGLPSVTQAGPSNLAGILQYCVQNNLLNGNAAGPVGSSLLTQGGSTADSLYQSGVNGLLQTGQGQSFDLGGSGMIADLKLQLCNLVLQHARSLL